MTDLAGRIALLSPEKRALFAARLAGTERPLHGLKQVPALKRGVPAPLSHNQRSVWFLDQLYPGNVAYNSPIAVRFSGQLDPNALEWSWNELIRRHDLLRTVFDVRDGDPVQCAKPFRPVRLCRMEFGDLPESERMEAAREEAVREAQQPFDLANGPAWRTKLLRCAEREHLLVVILHHIICDGWSIGILIRELAAGYEAYLRGKTSPLPELPIQYADYAAWQREQLTGPSFQRHIELWRKRLEGATDVLQIPLDKPRPAERTFRGARLFRRLSPQLSDSLRRIARREGATLFMVLLGAFKVLLSRYCGESDVIVGSQIANRECSEVEGLIGFFANTLALRTDLSGDPTFPELLARVRDSRTVAEHYKLSSTDRVLQFASLSFDAAVEEIFPTLIVGASLVMRRRDIWTTWECRQKLRELGITVLNLPTAYWEQLVQDWANEEDNLSTNVRLVLIGGEAMRPQSVDLWQRTPLRASRLLNTYGPTEATVVATTFEFPPTAHIAARVPIGKPLPGRLAYILDGNLEPVPVGVPGDLYLGGDCLARGYLNQPKLTAERFVADPHRLEPEARMYKTGDWARWLPDGNIEFIGRSDNQVKIRGFRIELGEVEVLLRHHAGVRDAVVVVQEDEPGQRQLVAYIVSRNGSAPEDLRSFLQGKLPSYMIPQAFVELDALPMTTSGKVDRRALPKPERQLQGYRAPRTPEEGILCGIYADLLSLERVGIDDNFFALGGHSLLAMQLASRVRRAFGVELALRTVFGAPTVAELIAQLPKAQEVSTSSTRQERPKEFPLSCPQRSVWFLDQLYPGNVAYNSPITLRFSGRLNANALEWSWNELVRRHDVLRTVFEPREGDPVQSAKPFCPARLHRMELGHLPESERMEAAREEAVRQAQQPFNLASGPPWRAKLLCCSEREHVLVVILHHIICDGWSIGILVRELAAGYEAFLRGETAPLPDLPLQYADYAAWQGEQLAGPGFKRHLDLWRMHLEGVTGAAYFPLDKPRPAEATFRGARLVAQLPPMLTESLRRIARSEGATLFMVLLGAFKVLLSRYSGESDIIVGSPIANRERYEFEGLIGFFANTLALRTDLSGDPTFVELLARVREVTLRAYDSQEVPFEKLVEELKPERQLDRNPFFDTSFSLQNSSMTTVNVPDLSIDLLHLDKGASKFELSLAMVETPRGLITTVSSARISLILPQPPDCLRIIGRCWMESLQIRGRGFRGCRC